jgi:endonuclease/exonuclease/phosphatase family metal-dependent hydrolase
VTDLRVMTYNVRSLRDDVDAVAAVVRESAPDVLLVQEAPRFLRWRSKRAALARRCGLVVGTADRPGGLCVMTALRVEIMSTSFALLPKTPQRHQRAVVSAVVRLGGIEWRVVSTHLSTDPAERVRHLPAIWSAVADDSAEPLVIGADVNEDPIGPVFGELAATLQDCFDVAGVGNGLTSPAISPRRRLDAIFADRAVTVVSCEAVSTPSVETASDHRPVLAVLRPPNGPREDAPEDAREVTSG